MNPNNHIILIIEDSDEDYYATERAFKKSGVANELHRCIDGEEALDYLYQRNSYSNITDSPKPNIILLDLNLPKVDGRTVLEEIKNNKELMNIPIIVLTTSTDERDIEQCYQAGANSYIQKPVNLENFMEAIKRLQDYWFEIVVLPKKE